MKKPRQHKFGEEISVVSHQLKTPLSVIKGYIEVLLSEDLGGINDKQKEYLMDILENTRQMIDLVRDILDITKIEANQLEFKPQKTDLTKIVRETIDEFSSLARAKNCLLRMDISEKIPLLYIDPIKIKQVIANIISNAINYNKRKGKAKISLSRKGKRVIFCCKDTGVGIPEREKKRVFSKFYRSEKAILLTTGGSGLGLFIAKAIIEKNGGKIWFESKEGRGSTFCFSLPVKIIK